LRVDGTHFGSINLVVKDPYGDWKKNLVVRHDVLFISELQRYLRFESKLGSCGINFPFRSNTCFDAFPECNGAVGLAYSFASVFELSILPYPSEHVILQTVC
jgi:hypothetical protein